MRLPKEIINVLGILVTVAIVAVGVVLIAVPLFTAALSQASAVAQAATANAASQAQIDRLKTAQQNLSATTAHVAELRRQIPVANDFDDVFQAVNAAARAAGATVTSVQPGTPITYAVRTAAAAAAAAAGTNGSSAPAPSPSPSPSAHSNATSSGVSTGGPTTPQAGTQQQVPVTIIVNVPNAKSSAAFLDALATGPRIVTVSHAALTDSGSSGGSASGQSSRTSYTLTVDAFTYTSAEG